MIKLVFVLLMIVGIAGLIMSYSMFNGLIQLALVVALVALGVHRILRYRVD
jgi:uncharacterized membrane protein